MYVTSLEVSKELYELSGWDGTSFFHAEGYERDSYKRVLYTGGNPSNEAMWGANHTPVYDLGYLLRKLPNWYEWSLSQDPDGFYTMWHDGLEVGGRWDADTPEDAAAKLAIELFKQGVLKKESN